MYQWGDAFIDERQSSATPARDRFGNDLGVTIYEAFFASFDRVRSNTPHKAKLVLTVDLRAKILRTVTLYDILGNVPPNKQDAEKRNWIGQRIMYNREKRGSYHFVTDKQAQRHGYHSFFTSTFRQAIRSLTSISVIHLVLCPYLERPSRTLIIFGERESTCNILMPLQ